MHQRIRCGIGRGVTLGRDPSQVKNLERKGAEEEAVPYADVARFLQAHNLYYCSYQRH
jgi:hypothetical protein